MSDSKTSRTQQASTSSDKRVLLYVPSSWEELTEEQLRYALTLLSDGFHGDAVKTYLLVRLTGIKVRGRYKEGWRFSKNNEVFFLRREQIASMLDALSFIDRLEGMSVHLSEAAGLHAVEGLLHEVPFGDYLKMEIAYQGYIISKKEHPLRNLFRLLYRDASGKTVPREALTPTAAELLGAFLWYSHIKRVFASEFTNLFRPAKSEDDNPDYDTLAAVNAQLRALTDGDVTKEREVKATDTWRCLTELDAKAREAREMNARLKKKPS